jgi:hypothetical protein
MKVTKEIIDGEVLVTATLTDDEENALGGVRIVTNEGSWVLGPGHAKIGNFALLRGASYAGETVKEISPDYANYNGKHSVDDIAKQLFVEVYDRIVAAKAAADASCGTVEVVSKQSAMQLLAKENRLYYRNEAGQIKRLD